MKVREILKDFNSSFLELSVSTRDFNYIFRRHKMFGEQDIRASVVSRNIGCLNPL